MAYVVVIIRAVQTVTVSRMAMPSRMLAESVVAMGARALTVKEFPMVGPLRMCAGSVVVTARAA